MGVRNRSATHPSCMRCGYDMTGLVVEDRFRCPECGAVLTPEMCRPFEVPRRGVPLGRFLLVVVAWILAFPALVAVLGLIIVILAIAGLREGGATLAATLLTLLAIGGPLVWIHWWAWTPVRCAGEGD